MLHISKIWLEKNVVNSVATYAAEFTQKPNCLLLVNAANLHDLVESVAKSARGNPHSHGFQLK